MEAAGITSNSTTDTIRTSKCAIFAFVTGLYYLFPIGGVTIQYYGMPDIGAFLLQVLFVGLIANMAVKGEKVFVNLLVFGYALLCGLFCLLLFYQDQTVIKNISKYLGSLFFVSSVGLGLITGFYALRKIKKSSGMLKGDNLAACGLFFIMVGLLGTLFVMRWFSDL